MIGPVKAVRIVRDLAGGVDNVARDDQEQAFHPFRLHHCMTPVQGEREGDSHRDAEHAADGSMTAPMTAVRP
jgi:hypothetical protein